MLKYHIQTVRVGSGGASTITFSGIPQVYDDLLLLTSVRTAAADDNLYVRFNNSTSGYTHRNLLGNGSGVFSQVQSNQQPGVQVHGMIGSTANTFGNGQAYVPNYRSSTSKAVSSEGVGEQNSATGYQFLVAGLWNSTEAINTLTMYAQGGGNFVEYSSASLYGIKRGTDGVTQSSPVAQGGTVSTSSGYTIHSFTSSGTFSLLRPATVDYLVVAGGGSGGATTSLVDYNTGAGGAGGYRYLTSQVLQPGSYSVVVGAGGSVEGVGTPGSDSSFFTTTATGGGAGGSGGGTYVQPTSGGSGGGGGTPGTLTGAAGNAGGYSPVEGYAGGNANSGGAGSTSGGGGGAGGAGGTPTAGPGVANSITGTSVTYATGGTGLSGGGTGSASNAAANTGNGGNAGRSQRYVSGLGGSGIVIIRYLTPA